MKVEPITHPLIVSIIPRKIDYFVQTLNIKFFWLRFQDPIETPNLYFYLMNEANSKMPRYLIHFVSANNLLYRYCRISNEAEFHRFHELKTLFILRGIIPKPF